MALARVPFSFKGRMRPLPYALWSVGVFLSQHLIPSLTLAGQSSPLGAIVRDWQFYVLPLQFLAWQKGATDAVLALTLVYQLLAAWALAALAFRRAADAEVNGWIASFAIAPVVQVAVILALSTMPSRASGRDASTPNHGGARDFVTAAQGLVAGAVLTVLAVALGALAFGTYGYGVFVASPFVVGATTGYLANRNTDIGTSRTVQLVAGSMLPGGILLVLAAIEGIICIILAAPLGLGAALIGGLLGRAIAVHSRRPPQQALCGFALLPVVFAVETVLPPAIHFDTRASIEISAPPDVVWKVLLRTDLSQEPVSLAFRLGLAYPIRGETFGEGVGAIRLGEFSTGTVLERVTKWAPNQRLAFVMLNDLPVMRELSPYAHVHAPHVVGYFRTTTTSFELAPIADGGTSVVERTSHQLRLEPVLYWLPIARWAVRENNARVLEHLKRQSEANHASHATDTTHPSR